MKSHYFQVLLLLLSVVFYTQPSQGLSPTVRVDLSDCGMQGASQFSGLLIRYQNRSFVVTSSWAQMSDSTPPCEKIWSANGALTPTKKVSDHLAGLSLYEVREKIAVQVPTDNRAVLQTLSDPGLQQFSGNIIASRSRRHSVPLVEEALEWKGPAVSSLVIGAPLWSQGQWRGLVSHQVLELSPGSKTISKRWDLLAAESEELTHNHLIVIPTAFILSWLEEQLTDPDEAMRMLLIWQPEDQRQGIDRFSFGPLEFTSVCPPNATTGPGEYPIGGNDGIGIGGDSVHHKACKIAVRESSLSSGLSLPLSLDSWLQKNAASLTAKNEMSIWYALRKDNTQLRRTYLFSVESLIKAALNDSTVWVDQTKAFRPPTRQVLMAAAAQELRAETLKCYSDIELREENIQDLLRKLFFISLLGTSSDPFLAPLEDLENLLAVQGPYALGWNILNGNILCINNRVRPAAESFFKEYKTLWPR